MLILNPERAQAQLDELDEQRVRAEARYSEVLAALVNQRDRADAAEAALNAARTELNRLHASEYPGGSRSPQGLHRHIALTVSRANGSARGETSISIAKIPGIGYNDGSRPRRSAHHHGSSLYRPRNQS